MPGAGDPRFMNSVDAFPSVFLVPFFPFSLLLYIFFAVVLPPFFSISLSGSDAI